MYWKIQYMWDKENDSKFIINGIYLLSKLFSLFDIK